MDLSVNNLYLIIFYCCTHAQIFLFYKVSYFNLNRTKYSMLQEFDVNLDLTAVFYLKKKFDL